MTARSIRTELVDRVLTLTFDRPDQLNRCSFQMLQEFGDALDQANSNDDVAAVVVTGAGRAFCAGTDLSGGEGSYDGSASIGEVINGVPRDAGGILSLKMFDYNKPLIAAINGPAVGYGVTMTLPMDVRIASTTARFGFVFAQRGLIPEACSTWFLPRIVGISRALEWFESGRIFEAAEALDAKLVTEVVAPAGLLARAHAIAHAMIDRSSSVSIMIARRMTLQMLGASHPMRAHELESRGIAQMRDLPDFIEGLASFREKRDAIFPMKAGKDGPEGFPWWPRQQFKPDA